MKRTIMAKQPSAPPRSDSGLTEIINDLDSRLFQIKEAASIVLEAVISANISQEVYGRVSFATLAIEDYAAKADATVRSIQRVTGTDSARGAA